MGQSKFRRSNEVKVFWGKSQPKEQLASKRQVAGMSHQGPAHAPSCLGQGKAAAGKVATGGSRSSFHSTSKNQNKENKTKVQHQHPLPEPKLKESTGSMPRAVCSLGEHTGVHHLWGSYTLNTWVRTTIKI